tara:strand:+ start:5648 stop:6745 length:1098 start_codon:yes stop_codon:yes gene_type:complete
LERRRGFDPQRQSVAFLLFALAVACCGCAMSGEPIVVEASDVGSGPTWTIQVSGTVVGPHGAPYSGDLDVGLRQAIEGLPRSRAHSATRAKDGRFRCSLRAPGFRHDHEAELYVEAYMLEPGLGIRPLMESAYPPHMRIPPPLKLTESTLVPPNTRARGQATVRVIVGEILGRAVCDAGAIQLDVPNPFGTLTVVGGVENQDVLIVFHDWDERAPRPIRPGALVKAKPGKTLHLHGWYEHDVLRGTVLPLDGYGITAFALYPGEDAVLVLRRVRTVTVALDPALGLEDAFVTLTSVDGTREIESLVRRSGSFGGRAPNPNWTFPCVEVGDYQLVVRRGSQEEPGEVLRTEQVLVGPDEDVHLDVK